MAKRPDPTACIVGGCKTTTKDGARVCTDHLHPRALQEEIERLGSSREGPWQDLLDRFPDARTLLEQFAVLADRAEPLKAAAITVTARSRGHGLGDGIVTLGDHIALPSYAASTKQDEGRLRAAVAGVRDCASRLERMLDPEEQPAPDPRPRCGRRSCSGRNVRQPVNIRWCGFCGRSMREDGTEALPASDERSQEPLESSAPTSEVREVNEVPEPRPAPPVAEGPAMRASLNGHRAIVVKAPSKTDAAIEGLGTAKQLFSELDIRAVIGVDPMPEGRWKVTVKVG